MKKSDAIAYFGSAAALARRLGISRGAVTNWGGKIPYARQCELEILSGGQLLADRRVSANEYPRECQPESAAT